MSDFHQTGLVATFHRLTGEHLDTLERSLEAIAGERGITLVLPCLFEEIGTAALDSIVRELRSVRYLREIVVTLGPAGRSSFGEARRFFSALPQKTTLVWNSGPRVQALFEAMRKRGLDAGPDGKGRSAWMAYGYILAERGSRVIALHDCDIVSYTKELLGRLVFPVASTQLQYEFCKGYYSRIARAMHGRVTRLYVTPFVRALMKVTGGGEILRYYDSFRYPLAGEFAMEADLARIIRLPSDWGLEVGVLAKIYRSCSVARICQSELCDNYKHKHQNLSPENKEEGLNRMAIEIGKSLLRTLATEGVVFTPGVVNTLRATYLRIARDTIERYHGDALINGLDYDRNVEGRAVEMFSEGIRTAGEIILDDPLGPHQIPNWNRVFSAIADFPERLLDAIRLDNA